MVGYTSSYNSATHKRYLKDPIASYWNGLSPLKNPESPEGGGILLDSRLSERVSPKRETQCFSFGNSGNLAQARKWSLEREKSGQAVRFSLERENLA
ncbi:hypothetical protein Lal_00038682 [Lupinus albus]|nr:hypothetical protein Lal_00038682 [Lupinus albus]